MFSHDLSLLRETVPRTNRQAIVTAIDPVPNRRPQFHRNGSLQLNGEIGDALRGVQMKGSRNRLCRACCQTSCAGPAMILLRRIRVYVRRGENYSYEKPVAQLPANQIRVLPDKP